VTPYQPPPVWFIRVLIFMWTLTACIALADTLCRCAGLDGCGWFWLPNVNRPLVMPE
jgi:hypothetical protein